MLVEGVSLDEYERRGDFFNIHNYWEWVNGKVIIIEFPSSPHEICIAQISDLMSRSCSPVSFTDAKIYGLGAARKFRFIDFFVFIYVILN